MDMEEEISRIRKEVENCRKCELWKTRKNPVPGEGPLLPKVMFIGEAPGFNEDAKGRPFVGRAGEVLDNALEAIDLERSEIYITNVLKCRPPGNRDPKPEEIRKCTPYLDRQVSLLRPGIIVTLGNFATSYLLEKFGFKADGIGKVHGKIFGVSNLLIRAKILPMYHPAVILRNPNLFENFMEDFRVLKTLMQK